MAADEPLTTTVPPTRVSRTAFAEALAALGLPTLDFVQATIEPNRVEATYLRRDDEGQWVVAGNELATVRYFTSVKDE